MCTISEKTDLKTVTVYKVCIKVDGKYYSPFAHYPIQTGRVDQDHWGSKLQSFNKRLALEASMFLMSAKNPHMRGRVSGFASRSNAIKLKAVLYTLHPTSVLKIVLGGDIMKGDSSGIAREIDSASPAYAGTEILSFKEINANQHEHKKDR